MKKVLAILTTIVLLALCFVSCEQGGTQDQTPEHTHSFGEWSITKNATCTEDGVKTRYCSCGENQSDSIPAIGHNYVEDECANCGDVKETSECKHKNLAVISGKDSNCFETGLTDGIQCLDCEKVLVAQQETSILEHTYDDKYDENCNECGFVREAECAHKETEVIKGYDATCTETGLTDGQKCKKCGEILTSQTIIGAKDHNYNNNVCIVCGYNVVLNNAEYITTNDGWVIAIYNEDAYVTTYVGDGINMTFPSSYNNFNKYYNLCYDYFSFDFSKVEETLEFLWICDNYNRPIKDYQFYNFDKLYQVIICDTITSIGRSAFGLCSNLKRVTIGEGVTYIGTFAFDQCYELEAIYYNAVHVEKVDGTPASPFEFCGRDSSGITVRIGENVKHLPNSLFSSWGPMSESAPNITNIIIPTESKLESIDSYCFRDCINIQEMYLPATLKDIFANAFERCGIHRVYYYGDKNSWNEIEIYGGNDTLHNATIYYYSPDAPTEAGNYWYYDELGNICIWDVEN